VERWIRGEDSADHDEKSPLYENHLQAEFIVDGNGDAISRGPRHAPWPDRMSCALERTYCSSKLLLDPRTPRLQVDPTSRLDIETAWSSILVAGRIRVHH